MVCRAIGKGDIRGLNVSVLVGAVCFDIDELCYRVTTYMLVSGVPQAGNTVDVHTNVMGRKGFEPRTMHYPGLEPQWRKYKLIFFSSQWSWAHSASCTVVIVSSPCVKGLRLSAHFPPPSRAKVELYTFTSSLCQYWYVTR